MKILSAAEIRDWDQFTIQHEPISSIDLMERASLAVVKWLLKQYPAADSYGIYCGKGNNGGDGLAIARILHEQHFPVSVHILEFGHKGTDDFQTNLARLHQYPEIDIHFVQSTDQIHPIPESQVIIDALFGSGLNRALEGLTATLVEHLNQSGNDIISIDIPSGLFTDRSSKGAIAIKAKHSLSFQCYKPAFLFAENSAYTGELHLLDIGLHPDYYRQLQVQLEITDAPLIRSIYKPRQKFAHKGHYGHALLVAGSFGKMGAAILSVRSCLHSGAGLVTCQIPGSGYPVMQSAVPEAMVVTDKNELINTAVSADLSAYDAIGIGPGIGTAGETIMLLHDLLDAYRHPVVLDADALNILGLQKDLLPLIPAGSILSPHPKEFERMFGQSVNDFDRAILAMKMAKELGLVIILKGHFTLIASPDGKGYFNPTGNPGMATAGSGDVLTGILTGLLAQGYHSLEAALLGVYLHGLAGDLAAAALSMEAMLAGDISDHIGKAYLQIQA